MVRRGVSLVHPSNGISFLTGQEEWLGGRLQREGPFNKILFAYPSLSLRPQDGEARKKDHQEA